MTQFQSFGLPGGFNPFNPFGLGGNPPPQPSGGSSVVEGAIQGATSSGSGNPGQILQGARQGAGQAAGNGLSALPVVGGLSSFASLWDWLKTGSNLKHVALAAAGFLLILTGLIGFLTVSTVRELRPA